MNIMNTIRAIIILQVDGRQSMAKYFDENLNSNQFEKRLFAKTKTPKGKDEVIVLDGVLVLHRFIIDSHIYIAASRHENPLVLDCVLNCLVEVVSSLSNTCPINNTVLDNLSCVILALDEICDNGLILETDPKLVLERIATTGEDSGESMASTARRLFGI